jgi:hypothetical protein
MGEARIGACSNIGVAEAAVELKEREDAPAVDRTKPALVLPMDRLPTEDIDDLKCLLWLPALVCNQTFAESNGCPIITPAIPATYPAVAVLLVDVRFSLDGILVVFEVAWFVESYQLNLL